MGVGIRQRACIELSVKAALPCTAGRPTKHWFADEEAKKLLDRIPEKLRHLEYHWLFLISKFWSFYTLAKYSNEELGLGPEKGR